MGGVVVDVDSAGWLRRCRPAGRGRPRRRTRRSVHLLLGGGPRPLNPSPGHLLPYPWLGSEGDRAARQAGGMIDPAVQHIWTSGDARIAVARRAGDVVIGSTRVDACVQGPVRGTGIDRGCALPATSPTGRRARFVQGRSGRLGAGGVGGGQHQTDARRPPRAVAVYRHQRCHAGSKAWKPVQTRSSRLMRPSRTRA